MCDVLLGDPGMCDKVCDRGGSKLAKNSNSVMYFMGSPNLIRFKLSMQEMNETDTRTTCICGSVYECYVQWYVYNVYEGFNHVSMHQNT